MLVKFRRIALVALALSATRAYAVHVDANGMGEVLIYPYYTVNKNQDTLLTIDNTGFSGKVVRVRAREGYNGRTVLQFNLFLPLRGSWTGVISALGDASTGARLTSNDLNCTRGFTSPQTFSSAAYDGTTIPNDGAPTSIARTREGFIEVIAMADVLPGTALDVAMKGVDAPPDCGNDIFASEDLITHDLTTPTTGIYGSSGIINVGQGTYFPYNAVAISGFYDIAGSTLYTPPTSSEPTLQSARNTAVPGGARVEAAKLQGDFVNIDFVPGNDAVTQALTGFALENEFLVNPALGAATDWVVTLPTKHFYVDRQAFPQAPIAPFRFAFADGSSSARVLIRRIDRQGNIVQEHCPIPGPSCPVIPDLKYETNVMEVSRADAPSNVLGSALSFRIEPLLESGTLQLDLASGSTGIATGRVNGVVAGSPGYPATGFMVYNVINANAQPGMLANYSGLFPHRTYFYCVSGLPGHPCY
jgi:hypothetical protein